MDRTSKYTQATKAFLATKGHATNAAILRQLRQDFPDVSATTVHRITARLVQRGELAMAPPAPDNAQQFDANLAPHDHFVCQSCGRLRDAQLAPIVKPFIEQAIGSDCQISGRLTISGVCKKCAKEGAAK